ncbi:MAG: hypothetical protein OIN86_04690 [Candidatus Methanoperedens sp.]|nr:hypothetical protein [Candidatus Methanoperedens sp.]CAG0996819.1 hypothetical protein METP1_02621 [Methanosarcinales archaeon]
MKQFEHILFNANPEKLQMLRDYCNENAFGCYEIVENIPVKNVKAFNEFLKDNQICDDKTCLYVPIPKNQKMLQELKKFAVNNGFQISIDGTEALLVNVPIVVLNSMEFEELLIKLEREFEQELKL